MNKKQNKSWLILALVLTVSLMLAPVWAWAQKKAGAAAQEPAAAEKQPKYVWKIATPVPKGMGYGRVYEKVVFPAFTQASEGDIQLKVFWSGIQGDSPEVIEKIHDGRLQGAALDARGSMLAMKEFAVLQLPFLFNDYQEVDYIRDKMFDQFQQVAEKNGLMIVLWVDQDFDQIYSTTLELSQMAKFSQVNLANWCGTLEKRTFEALGATTTVVNSETVGPSLKKGETNTLCSPAIWVVGAQLHSVFRYVNPVKIRYAPATVLFSLETYNKMPKKYHDKYAETQPGVQEQINKAIRRDNKKCMVAMVRYGVKQVKLDDKNLEAIKAATRPLWDETAGTLFPKELLNQVLAHLAEYRKQ